MIVVIGWIITAILLCALFYYYIVVRDKRSKSPPLPRSEKVAVELLILPHGGDGGGRKIAIEKRIVSLNVYLPSDQFLANMKKAVSKERSSLKVFWDSEKDVFRRVWHDDYSYYRRCTFIRALLKELEANIDAYTDSDKMSEYLCPQLYDNHKLLSNKDMDNSNGVDNNDNVGNGMYDLISQVANDSIGKSDAFDSISAVVLKATKESADAASTDPDASKSRGGLDLDLSIKTELLLFTLKQLCMVMFVKHFLARYLSSEPPVSICVRLYRRLGPSYVCSLALFIAVFVLDISGLLSKIIPNYASMFLLKDSI